MQHPSTENRSIVETEPVGKRMDLAAAVVERRMSYVEGILAQLGMSAASPHNAPLVEFVYSKIEAEENDISNVG